MALSNSQQAVPEQSSRAAPASWRGRIGVIATLASIGFNVLLVTALIPVLSTIGAYFGGGARGALIAQSIETMSGIGVMIGGPLAGWVAGRIGARNLLLAALALYGVAGSAGLFVDNAPGLLGLRLIQGFGSAGIAISTFTMVSEWFEGPARARVLGYQGSFVSATGIVSLLIAGAIADDHGWRSPFALYLSAFVMLAVALATVPATTARADGKTTGSGGSVRALLPLYALIVPLYLVANMVNLHMSFVLAADGVTRPSAQSRIMLASSLLYMVGGLVYGRIVVRLGARRMLVLILALLAASSVAIGLSHEVAIMTAGVGLSGLASGFLIPFIANLVLNRAAPEARSRALGFMYTAMYIGNFLNPLVMTPLRQAIGNHLIFLALGVVLGLAAMAQAFARRSVIAEPAAS